MAASPTIEVRIRAKTDPARDLTGRVDGQRWLVVGADDDFVLEVQMGEVEFASETIDRFVRAHDSSTPALPDGPG